MRTLALAAAAFALLTSGAAARAYAQERIEWRALHAAALVFFAGAVLKPGERRQSTTVFKFSAVKGS